MAYAAVGLLITWHRPANPVGRISLVAAAAWGPGQALVDLGANALRDDPTNRSAALASMLGSALGGVAWLVLVLWLPLVFPDGTTPTTRLRRTARLVVATTLACFTAVSLFSPHLSRIEFDTIDNPIGVPHSLTGPMDGLAGLNLLLGLASLGLAVACLVQQYRHGGPLTRQQSLIFGLAFVPPVLALLASFSDSAGPWLFGVSTLPLPVAIGIAVLQRRLYDLPLVVNRSATYALLWLAIAALYAVVVGGVGAMLRQEGASWLPWLAAGVIAVSFAPLRDALQRAANRLTFGQWAQPGEVLTRTARRLSDAGDVQGLLETLATELAEDLGLGRVEIVGSDGRLLATAGTPVAELDDLPLTAYGAPVGALRWTRRPLREARPGPPRRSRYAARLGGARPRPARHRARRPGATRRRPRGGAPTPATRPPRRARPSPGRADDAGRHRPQHRARRRRQCPACSRCGGTSRTRSATSAASSRDCSPRPWPTSGSRSRCASSPDGSDTSTASRSSWTPTPPPSSPRPWRSVPTASSRSRSPTRPSTPARHHLRVGVHLHDGCLEVCVADDGSGVLRPRADGVGLTSMRERAEEIGGRLEILAAPGTGTTVRARLPVDGRPTR